MNEQTKPCHFCGEQVLGTAIKCKHCGEFLNQIPPVMYKRGNYRNANYNVKTRSQSCSLAIIAFILSLISIFTGFTFIPGIICGHLAIAQCNRDPSLSGRGFAVASLVIGYIILVFAFIVAMFWLGLAAVIMSE